MPVSEIVVPEDIVFTYDSRSFRSAVDQTAARQVGWYIYDDRLFIGGLGAKEVGIVHAMVGAPAAAMNLEELIAYGAKRIYEVGLSGAIDATLEPGDAIVLTGALSDEGASRHYFRASPRFSPSVGLTKRLRSSMEETRVKHVTGDAWTVDAPYMETVEKVVRFRRRGARVVNMESSALFAVAKFRGVDAASVQIVSDVVSERQWNPAFHREVVDKRRKEVLAAVLRAIKG